MAVSCDVHTPMPLKRYRLPFVIVASQKFRLTRRIFNAMKTSPCQANQHPQPNGRGPLLAPVARHVAQHTTHDTHPSNKLGDSPLLLPSGIRRWNVRKRSKCCKLCWWLILAKQVVCKDPTVQTVTSWQLMNWGTAQAGNRASKTSRYLQWWENNPEQDAVSSALQNLHNSVCYCWHLFWAWEHTEVQVASIEHATRLINSSLHLPRLQQTHILLLRRWSNALTSCLAD